MSVDTQNQIYKLNCFGKLSTKYCEPRKGKKRTFHESIQKSKDFFFDFFERQPYYNDVMPTIIRNNRGMNFYKSLIKKGLEGKSVFFKSIMSAIDKSVKESLEKNKKKTKKLRYYKIPKIELIKSRKEKIENYMQKKNQKIKRLYACKSMIDLFRKKKQPISETTIKSTINDNKNINKNNNNLNTISIDTSYTNNNKNESMRNLHNNYSLKNLKRKIPKINITRNYNKEIKHYFYNNNESCFQSSKLDLITKCNEELKLAQNMENYIEGYSKNKSGEDFGKKIKNVLKNKDQKVIEYKGIGNKKYQKLEKEKFKELKKKMDIKVSDDYAYVNRKELYELIRDNETISAYQIYLRDMKKFNAKLNKKKEMEKKNTSLVENLLEDTYKKKEFLKRKVDNYYIKHAKDNEIKMFYIQNKDEFCENKDNDKEQIRGTLLPKLIDLKEYCYGRPKYDPNGDLENN